MKRIFIGIGLAFSVFLVKALVLMQYSLWFFKESYHLNYIESLIGVLIISFLFKDQADAVTATVDKDSADGVTPHLVAIAILLVFLLTGYILHFFY